MKKAPLLLAVLLLALAAALPSQAGPAVAACPRGRCSAAAPDVSPASAAPLPLRLLNHWDNPDGTVERGYAGRSIWRWDLIPDRPRQAMPDSLRRRYDEYGRLNHEFGINGTVLNNVNAKPLMLSTPMLRKTAKIADVLRPHGLRVYLSVNFASPKALGGLPTADPLDPRVQRWWERKAREIYRLIPDFGGFLVKANSEGEPGPMDYGRTHADGANMLARALQPHGGIVMWRAFVYSPQGGDRASQAYDEFIGLDGQFLDNVIIQIKNGPVDFQPREPVSPLFFGLRKTKMMAEFQIAQEYTGHSIHTCFLAPMWHEFFQTLGLAPGSPFAPADGSPSPAESTPLSSPSCQRGGCFAVANLVGLAGVANTGSAPNWTANDLALANWYAFGQLALDPAARPDTLADRFLRRFYTADDRFVRPVARLLVQSYETLVSYMMPLGLHHIFAADHHYGPEPWCQRQGWREDWLPSYYHRADTIGLGFNRTDHDEPCLRDARGSGNVDRYPEPLRTLYNNVDTCPLPLLLWFHHVPWNHQLRDAQGQPLGTLWQVLCRTWQRQGVEGAEAMLQTWRDIRPFYAAGGRTAAADPAVAARYEAQLHRFERQAKDALWWRDACLLYFQQFARQPFPPGLGIRPQHTLRELQDFRLGIDNYTAPRPEQLP